MKKILMLSAMSLIFATSSVFAACPCQVKKVECDPCVKPKVTCCQPACPDTSYRAQCCNKKNIFQRMWSGTKTAYDNSFGAIYNTIADPFRY